MRTTRLPARSIRSAMLRHQPSSTPTIAVPLRLHAGDQALLDRGIMFQRAVAIDMVFADIEQDADRGIERRREVDLVRRHLDHMDAAHARRLQRQDRGADIAAHLGVVAGDPHQMRDQRRGGRFAVGAGDRDERRVRRVAAAFAAKQFDIADHLDAGLPRRQHGPVRRRMGQRRAGRQHQRGEIRPRYRAQIGGDEAGLRCLASCRRRRRRRSLPRRPPSGHGSSQARAAEAEHRNRLARKGGDGDHEACSRAGIMAGACPSIARLDEHRSETTGM